jgi:hypothetical protein
MPQVETFRNESVIGKSTQTQELRQHETVRSLVSAHLQSYKQKTILKSFAKINNSLWWQSKRQGQTEQNAKAKPASIKGLSRQTDTEITQTNLSEENFKRMP